MQIHPLSILLLVLYGVYPIVSIIYINRLYQGLVQSDSKRSVLLLGMLVLFNGVIIALLGIYSYGVWFTRRLRHKSRFVNKSPRKKMQHPPVESF
jgi:hypothetical protein